MKAKIYAISGVILFFWSMMIGAGDTIDLSEAIMKVNMPNIFNPIGKEGFAVFDSGDQQLKFFNWRFKCEQTMPLTLGEGPGEIKMRLQSVCRMGTYIYNWFL